MVAYAYHSLGGISSVTNNSSIPYSKRGRDADRFENFSFKCDPDHPFTGIVHLQGSLDDPQIKDSDRLWVDIAQIEFNNEGGIFFLQTEIELSSSRIVCKPNNYWSAAFGTENASITANGTFTINGIGPITVSINDTANDVANAINNHSNIISNGTIFADVFENKLRIYKNDGANLVLLDVTNSPLADMGIVSSTYMAGKILTINSFR